MVVNEDIAHLFDCHPVRTVWNWIEIKLQNINIQYGDLSIFSKIVGILDDEPWTEYVNMILSHTRWLVWKSRCKNRYEDPEDKHTNLLNYVKLVLKNHLRILLKVNKGKRIDALNRIYNAFEFDQ